MSDVLTYATPSEAPIRPWLMAFGCAAVLLALIVPLPFQFLSLSRSLPVLVCFYLVPTLIAGVAIVVSVPLLAAALRPQAESSRLPMYGCMAAAFVLLGIRIALATIYVLRYGTGLLNGEIWGVLAAFLACATPLLLAGLLVCASRYFVGVSARIAQKAAGLIVLLALLPSVLFFLLAVLYQLLRALALLTHAEVLNNITLIRFYSSLSNINTIWLAMVWFCLTLTAGILALRNKG